MPLLPRPAAQASVVVDLARIVGAQHVSNADADRLAYSHDCWPRDLLRLRAGEVSAAPSCVVWPGSADEVARVLQYAQEVGVAVVPFGAGSGVSGGARPSEGGIVLDLKRLKTIRRLDRDNLRLEAEVGIIGERLERRLDAQGFTLGHFPSSIVCSTLGGWLAARSAGQASTLYGKIEDMTFGLEMATPGHLRRLMLGPRPADGPDVNALILGSEGIFGAITAAELRIRPKPAARQMFGLMFPDVQAGLEAIRSMLRAGLRPAVVRLYDALDTFAGRSSKEEALDEVTSWDALAARAQTLVGAAQKKLPAPGVTGRLRKALVKGTMRAVLGAPLALNRALDFLPSQCLLIIGFEGHPALVAAEVALAKDIANQHDAEDLGPGPGQHWLKNRYNVSFKQSKVYASGLFVDTMEVAATWDRLLPLYRGVKRAIGKDAVVMAHFSHAYGEGCSIYFTFAGLAPDPRNPSEALVRYDRIWKNALAAVHEAGGTISHHHGVGESKAAGMAREHGAGGMRLLKALKTAFDPRGVVNPGKLGLEVTTRRVRPRRDSLREAPSGGIPKEMVRAVGERNVFSRGVRTVVRPPDESSLAAILRVAHARGMTMASDQTGYRPARGAMLVDLERFEGVARMSEHSLFVEVEAGMQVGRLERLLNAHRLTLGAVHPRAVTRTVGAALSRNLLVRRGVAFGDLRDLCFAIRGLLANGAAIETRPVPRAAVGPELDRAFVGAQGRFGIITKATLRISVMPSLGQHVAYRFPHLIAAAECARRVLQRGVKPAAGRVWPKDDEALLALELVAPTTEALQAQIAIVASLASEASGTALSDEPQVRTSVRPGTQDTAAPSQFAAVGGRFDAVVEVASLWTKAVETLQSIQSASGAEGWLDFMSPEGVTAVTRILDAQSRADAIHTAIAMGARVVAGTRDIAAGDQESFSQTMGEHWRDVPFLDEEGRQAGPYDDILDRVTQQLDPAGVFRTR